MVYAVAGELMSTTIHALSIKAYTPEEFIQQPTAALA
jgi:acid stress-induced BolA-like protein IbaG/YrbA